MFLHGGNIFKPRNFLGLRGAAVWLAGATSRMVLFRLDGTLALFPFTDGGFVVIIGKRILPDETLPPFYQSNIAITILNVLVKMNTATKVLNIHLKMLKVSKSARLLFLIISCISS